MTILILVIGIILFISLIVVHEFGHFMVATRNGVVAEEFGIFFGPAIYKRKTKKGWTFKINSVPLGGYVKLKGEHDSDFEPGSYGVATLWIKTKIMAAGVIANLIVGLILLAILALIGLPQIIPNQFSVKSNQHTIQTAKKFVEVGSILSNTPATQAGLKAGDEITAIGPKNNLKPIKTVSGLQAVTKKFAGQKVLIDYIANNKHHQTSTTLNTTTQATIAEDKTYLGLAVDDNITAIGPKNNLKPIKTASDVQPLIDEFAGQKVLVDYVANNKHHQISTTLNANSKATIAQDKIYLGVAIGVYSSGVTLVRYTWAAPVVALGLTKQVIVLTFEGLGRAIGSVGGIISGIVTHNTAARKAAQSTASQQVAGPLAIAYILHLASTINLQFMLFIVAIISLSLAIVNILPIPALDGGRLWSTLISRGIKHPMSANVEEMINAIGFVFIILLVGLITYANIVNHLY